MTHLFDIIHFDIMIMPLLIDDLNHLVISNYFKLIDKFIIISLIDFVVVFLFASLIYYYY